METSFVDEFQRLSDNASLKRDLLLAVARGHARRRKRLTLAAGILALLSAATVTSLLADYTPAPATKLIAVILSTASGFISLLGNLGVKDGEIQDLYAGAARYLSLRESSHRVSLNKSMGEEERYRLLEEMQGLYSQLDEQFMRYIEEEAPTSRGREREGFGLEPLERRARSRRVSGRPMGPRPKGLLDDDSGE